MGSLYLHWCNSPSRASCITNIRFWVGTLFEGCYVPDIGEHSAQNKKVGFCTRIFLKGGNVKNSGYFHKKLIFCHFSDFVGHFFPALSTSILAETQKFSITINIFFEKLKSRASFVILRPKLRAFTTTRATFKKWAQAPKRLPTLFGGHLSWKQVSVCKLQTTDVTVNTKRYDAFAVSQ